MLAWLLIYQYSPLATVSLLDLVRCLAPPTPSPLLPDCLPCTFPTVLLAPVRHLLLSFARTSRACCFVCYFMHACAQVCECAPGWVALPCMLGQGRRRHCWGCRRSVPQWGARSGSAGSAVGGLALGGFGGWPRWAASSLGGLGGSQCCAGAAGSGHAHGAPLAQPAQPRARCS